MKTAVIFLSLFAYVGSASQLRGSIVFPTPELALVARISDYDTYEQLFLSLEYNPAKNSVKDFIKIRDDAGASQIDIFGYGANLLLTGPVLASAVQQVWTGKIYSFAKTDSPDLGTYTNIVAGQQFWTGIMYSDTFSEAMERNGESPPVGSLPGNFGPLPTENGPMVLDNKESLIVDYIAGDLGSVLPLLEECRPLTAAALRNVGVFIGPRVDRRKLKDTFLCRSTNMGPLDGERAFFLHFVFQFDRDTIELVN